MALEIPTIVFCCGLFRRHPHAILTKIDLCCILLLFSYCLCSQWAHHHIQGNDDKDYYCQSDESQVFCACDCFTILREWEFVLNWKKIEVEVFGQHLTIIVRCAVCTLSRFHPVNIANPLCVLLCAATSTLRVPVAVLPFSITSLNHPAARMCPSTMGMFTGGDLRDFWDMWEIGVGTAKIWSPVLKK